MVVYLSFSILNELDEESLIKILTEPKNALVKQYAKLFALEGVDLTFQEKALKLVAQQALTRKSGARGLRSIMEHTLLDTMYALPAMKDVEEVVINDEVVSNQASPLYVYKKKEKTA